jgi:hypothetical protein
MSIQLSPTQALRAYRDELAAAGVSPLATSPEQENRLQELVVAVWEAEAS